MRGDFGPMEDQPLELVLNTDADTSNPNMMKEYKVTYNINPGTGLFNVSNIQLTNATLLSISSESDFKHIAVIRPEADGEVTASLSDEVVVTHYKLFSPVEIKFTIDSVTPTVTLDQTTDQRDPSSDNTVNFKAVFSEKMESETFTAEDLSNLGTAPVSGWTLNSNDGIHWNITASVAGPGTVIPKLNASSVEDIAGNLSSASTSTDNTVTLEFDKPSIAINQAAGQQDPTGNPTVNFSVIFSEEIDQTTFTADDITNAGSAGIALWTISKVNTTTYNITATVTTSGSVIPFIAADKIKDIPGNFNTASAAVTDNNVIVDITGPSVIINKKVGQQSPTRNSPILFTLVFSEPIDLLTFTNNDISQTGTAAVSAWSLSTSDNITWTVTATGVGNGSVIPVLNANSVTDIFGNFNFVSSSTDNTVVFDSIDPSVVLTQKTGQIDPTKNSSIAFTATFSEAIDATSFTAVDISQSGDAGISGWSLTSTDNIIWTLTTTATSSGLIRPFINASSITDIAGNSNVDSTEGLDNQVVFDNISPAVTIDQALSQPDPTSSGTIQFTIVFSEPINPSSFTATDINCGTAPVVNRNLQLNPDNQTALFTVTMGTTGVITPSIAAGVVIDPAGNLNTTSTSTDASVTYDNNAVIAIIARSAGQADPTKLPNMSFILTFDKPITESSFPVDFSQNTAALSGWSLVKNSSTNFTINATASSEGTVKPRLLAGVVHDSASNPNSASAGANATVTYDITSPTINIYQNISQADPTNNGRISFTFEFSEPITASDFTAGDITAGSLNTVSVPSWTLTSADNITWIATTGSLTASGTIQPILLANKITDLAGNNNLAYVINSSDNVVTFDNTPPTLVLTQATSPAQADPTNTLPIRFIITANEPINPTTFNIADITQAGSASGITWLLSSGDNINWSLQASAVAVPGTIIPTIATSKVTDLAGNSNVGATTYPDNSVIYDIIPPAFTITQATWQTSDPTNVLPIFFTITASEPINLSTFTTSNITQTSGSGYATGIVWNLAFNATQTVGTLSATAVSGIDGIIKPNITIGTIADLAGNTNTAIANVITDNAVIYDITPPSLTINKANSQLDPTNTNPIVFTVEFSEPINPTSFIASDISLGTLNTATISNWNLTTSDNKTWTASATASSAGTVAPIITASKVTDPAGNNNTVSTSTYNHVEYDNILPMITTFTKQTGQATTTSKVPIQFSITFSEDIDPASFTTADINYNGTATGVNWSLTQTSELTWTLTATSSGYGTINPYINPAKFKDPAGNWNNTTFTCSDTISYIQITLSVADVAISEGSNLSFTVLLNSAHDQNVNFDWSTSAITATAGTDYTTSSGVGVVINAGSISKTISVPTTVDTLYENDETLNVTITNVTVATINDGTAIGTITNDDPKPTANFNLASTTLSEISGANTAIINLSAISGLLTSVPYSVTGSASNPADHNLSSGTLNINAGLNSGTINFSFVNDNAYEPNETLIITMGSITNGLSGATTTETITLTSEDPPPNMMISSATAAEGDTILFAVTLDTTSGYPASAIFNTANGTALSGIHYTSTTGTITVPAGSLTSYIAIPTLEVAGNQNSAEWKFSVNLSSASNTNITVSTATGTIQDDDNPPSGFAITGITGGNDSSFDNFLTDGSIVTVNWQISAGADRYTVTIRNSADTADVCSTQSTTNLFYQFASCPLTDNTSYKVIVTAWRIASPINTISLPYLFTVKSGLPGAFEITGITGGTADTTADHFLEDGVFATVNWTPPDATSTFDVAILNTSGGVVCSAIASANTSSLNVSGCTLSGAQYFASVQAKDSSLKLRPATNSLYPFQLPIATNFNCPVNGSANTTITNSFLGNLYDSGGPINKYANKETCTVTLNPTGANWVTLQFMSFITNHTNDNLTIYDGTSASALNIKYGPYSQSNLANGTTINATSGAAYLSWVSKNGGQTELGWNIYYKSEPPSPGSFSITGITSSSDSTFDAWLQGSIAYPTVNWSASSTAGSYSVWIEDAQNRTIICPAINTTTTAYSMTGCNLSVGGTYKAFVVARDSWGNSNQALNNSFSFTYDIAPAVFTITGITGGTDTVTDATLSDGWNPTVNFDNTTGETAYAVTLFNDNGTTLINRTTTTPDITNYNFTAGTVTSATFFKVKVEAISASGLITVASGGTYRFYVSSLPQPPGPFNITGVTGGNDDIVDSTLASTVYPQINWQPSPRATSYKVTIYQTDGSTVVCPQSFTNTSNYNFASCGLTNGNSYKVKVIAIDPTLQETEATNSMTYTFSVNTTPPSPFTITGITGGLDVTADTYLLDGNFATANWNSATGASTYKVTLYTTSGSTPACASVFPVSVTGTSAAITGCSLTEDTVYLLRVAARDSIGNETLATNDLFAFMIDSLPTITLTGGYFPEGVGSAKAYATLNHPSLRTVSFKYYTSGGSPNIDYTTVGTTTITIPVNNTSATLPVTLLEDTSEEATENFNIQISNASFAVIGISNVTMYIEDNDGDNWLLESGDTTTTAGTWGTKDLTSASNIPSARYSAAGFQSTGATFYLFGGYGFDSVNSSYYLNDFWKFETASKQWTWIGGSNVTSGTLAYGIYGTQNISSGSNIPGGRRGSSSTQDTSGNLWLFGGFGNSSNNSYSYLCDLWQYNTAAKEWVWRGPTGSNTSCNSGSYGTLGTPSTSNYPAGRQGSAMWSTVVTGATYIWIFGGYNSNTYPTSYYNDLWRFNPATSEWTWMNGSNTPNAKGIFGTQLVENSANTPGARYYSAYTQTTSGTLWLYAGNGYDALHIRGELNDLWRFNPTNGYWTWVSGSNAANKISVNDLERITRPDNLPGGNSYSTMWSSGNFLWIYTGILYDPANPYISKLWRFETSTGLWTFQKGVNTSYNYVPNYNVNYPSHTRTLSLVGEKRYPVAWVDTNNEGWLFSGEGGTGNGGSGSCCSSTKTLWHFKPDPVKKLLIGDSSANEGSNLIGYASMNYPATGTISFNWTTANNSAIAATDYTSSFGTTIKISTGSSYAALTVPILSDSSSEPQENFFINLSSATGAPIVRTSGIMSINDSTGYIANIKGSNQITAGSCSAAYFIEVLDRNGKLSTNPTADTAVLSGNGAGTFYSNSTCTTTITSLNIAAGAKTSSYFYIKDNTAENLSITAGSFTSSLLASNAFPVNVAGSTTPTKLNLIGPANIQKNTCSLFIVSTRDEKGAPSSVASNQVINLKFESPNAKIYGDSGCANEVTTATMTTNNAFVDFYLKATEVDVARLLKVDHATYGLITQLISVSGPMIASRIRTVGPSSILVGSCNYYDGDILTDDGVNYTGNSTYSVNLASSSGKFDQFNTCTNNYANVFSSSPSGKFGIYFKSDYLSNELLVFSSGTFKTWVLPVNVTKTQTNKLIWTGANSATTNACTPYTLNVYDSNNNSVILGADLIVNTYSLSNGNSYNYIYADSGCGTVVTTATLGSGTSSKPFYFKATSSNVAWYTVATAIGYDTSIKKVYINASGNQINVTGATLLNRLSCGTYAVNYLNSSGTSTTAAANVSFTLTGANLGEFYSDNTCSILTSTGTILTGGSFANFYYKTSFISNDTVLRAALDTEKVDATLAIQTVPIYDVQKVILNGVHSQSINVCSQIDVNLLAADNKTAIWNADITVNLSGYGSGGFYSNSTCTSATLTSMLVSAGTSNNKVYYKNNSAQVVTLKTTNTTSGTTLLGSDLIIDVQNPTSIVDAGYQHTCAIRNNAAYCWGYNGYGQLGDNSYTNRAIPAQVNGLASNVTGITAGHGSSCAIQSGAIKCWGQNYYGQLGNSNYSSSSIPVQVTGATAGATLVKSNLNYSGTTCAIINGGLKCWGYNGYGIFGNNTTVSSNTPVDVTGFTSEVTDFDIGTSHICAVKSGAVYCWGSNANYKVGNSSNSGSTLTPYSVPGLTSGASKVAVNDYYSCVLLNAGASGNIKCWGYNYNAGILANGTAGYNYIYTPTSTNNMSSDVTDINSGASYICAVKNGAAYCWGDNGNFQSGSGSGTKYVATMVTGLSMGVSSISGGYAQTCAITYGNLSCWGYNNYGQAGEPMTAQTYPIPVDSFNGTALKISAGGMHTCAINSSNLAYCWGYNLYNQVGNSTSSEYTTIPVAVNGIAGTVTAIATGANHSCAINNSAAAYCWGYNYYGQLGNGSFSSPTSAGTVALLSSGVTYIGAGNYHTCALKNGTVYCWGSNSSGQLGIDSTVSSASIPTPVVSLGSISALVVGGDSNCALDNGAVKCWGYNYNYAVGYPANNASLLQPYTLPSLSSGVTGLYGGNSFYCAVVSGLYYCWGSGNYGEFALGSGVSTYIPTLTPFSTNISKLTSGGINSFGKVCAIDSGRPYCWGYNAYGEVGYGGTSPVSYMTPIQYLTNVIDISIGQYHTCAISSSGKPYCWGNTTSGRTGIETISNSSGASIVAYPQSIIY